MQHVTKKYSWLIPVAVFQTIIIAGGYGTGQEFNQFFLSLGPINGLLGIIFSGLIWSLACALSYKFAFQHQAYNYKQFFFALLGRKWYLFEIAYIVLLITVLSVVIASTGHLSEVFGYSYNSGILLLNLCVLLSVHLGKDFIEKFFSVWSCFVVSVYFIVLFTCLFHFKATITANMNIGEINGSWILAGIKYSGYNLGLIPTVLFSLHHVSSARTAVMSGILSGIWGIFPGLLFYIAMLALYPSITSADLPFMTLIDTLKNNTLMTLFSLALFGTLIQTATGILFNIALRLPTSDGADVSNTPLIIFCLSILGVTSIIAQFSLINLINYGYGAITWLVLTFYLLPLLYYSYKQNT